MIAMKPPHPYVQEVTPDAGVFQNDIQGDSIIKWINNITVDSELQRMQGEHPSILALRNPKKSQRNRRTQEW
jgi:hypothetical protein